MPCNRRTSRSRGPIVCGAEQPRALLTNPAGQDRLKQGLLEMQRPHPIAEHAGELVRQRRS